VSERDSIVFIPIKKRQTGSTSVASYWNSVPTQKEKNFPSLILNKNFLTQDKIAPEISPQVLKAGPSDIEAFIFGLQQIFPPFLRAIITVLSSVASLVLFKPRVYYSTNRSLANAAHRYVPTSIFSFSKKILNAGIQQLHPILFSFTAGRRFIEQSIFFLQGNFDHYPPIDVRNQLTILPRILHTIHAELNINRDTWWNLDHIPEPKKLITAGLSSSNQKILLHPKAFKAWSELQAFAEKEKIVLKLEAGFISYTNYASKVIESTNDTIFNTSKIPPPGFSNFHSGKTLKISAQIQPKNENVHSIDPYHWLKEHAYRFGFWVEEGLEGIIHYRSS
jgi:hypothetical protein